MSGRRLLDRLDFFAFLGLNSTTVFINSPSLPSFRHSYDDQCIIVPPLFSTTRPSQSGLGWALPHCNTMSTLQIAFPLDRPITPGPSRFCIPATDSQASWNDFVDSYRAAKRIAVVCGKTRRASRSTKLIIRRRGIYRCFHTGL